MPERLAIDGFLRGRRYVTLEGSPGFFTLYNVRDRDVLAGAEYQARLNSPTEWTRRANTYFANESRSLCDVLFSRGVGAGGMLGTIRFDCDPDRDVALEEALAGRILRAIAERQGIAATRLCRADIDISRVRTAENEGREDNRVPRWVILVEAGDPAPIGEAFRDPLAPDVLAALGIPDTARAIHRLQHDLVDMI